MSFRNKDEIRAADPKLFEALSDLDRGSENLELQVNGNRKGQPLPPPAIDGLSVTGQNGHFHLQITHKADIYRGIQYYAEFADNPGFQDAHTIPMGDSRSLTQFLGNGAYYWRAYAAYASSSPGPAAYHGGGGTPQPVAGGGIIGPPALLPSQGSGTGLPGEGLVGPGITPFRSTDGAPPLRGKTSNPGGSGASGGSLPADPSTGLPEGASSTFATGGGGGGGAITSSILAGTHAGRLSGYPSVQYPLYTAYFETDRLTFYWVRNATGTLTVAGGVNVTWVSGDHFINTGTGFDATQWPAGTIIVINGIPRVVAVVNSATSLTLQAAAPDGVGLSYSVASGRWVYVSGTMPGFLAIPVRLVPSDLGENDAGFMLNATDYYHLYQWTGSAWTWGPGDGANGGDIVISAGVKTPAISGALTPGAWKLLDGTGDDCANPVSVLNPVSFAGENTGLVYLTTFDDAQDLYFKGAAAFSGTANAETVPEIGGVTDSASAGVTAGTADFTAGAVTALTPPLDDPGHQHALTPANAPITLPADPIRWMGGKPYLRR